ncbi:MAG: hypothetical protein H7Z75_08875 [Ferruginibacter sp.]|nr:hypothetical protein [Cytophagales bacterium]
MNQSDQDKPGSEEEWRRALEGAELGPSDRVWAGLDHHLAGKARQRQRRLAYVGMAASLLICLGWGVGWYQARPESRLAAARPTGSEEAQRSARRPEAVANRKHPTNVPVGDARLNSERKAVFQTESPQATNPRPAPDGTAGPTPPAAGQSPSTLLSDSQAPVTDQKRSTPTSEPNRLSRTRPASPNVGQLPNPRESPFTHGKPTRPLNAAVERSRQLPGKLAGARWLGVSADGNRPAYPAMSPLVAVLRPSLPTGLATGTSAVSDRRLRSQPTVERTFASPLEIEPAPKKSSLWVSTVFATTYFDPNVRAFYPQINSASGVANFASFNASNTSRSVNKIREGENLGQPGLSYAVGLHAGADLSKRWTLEGGVEYLYNNSQLRTGAYKENLVTNTKYPLITDLLSGHENSALQAAADVRSDAENYVFSTPPVVSLNATSNTVAFQNDYQYLGLPLRLGYQINRHQKLRFVGLGGVSADLFLRNVHGSVEESKFPMSTFSSLSPPTPLLMDNAGERKPTVITAGKNSTYRSLSVSALLGLGIHYHYSRHFSLMLEPTYRTALYSTTKTTSNVRTLPSNLGIGTGLKYHF